MIRRAQPIFTLALAVGLAFAAAPGWAQQDPPKQEPPKQEQKPQEPPKPQRKPGDPKPYEEVVTKDAKTQAGVFKVHEVENKWYWEIPKNLLGRDFFWSTEIAEVPTNRGYGGTFVGDRVVRFSRRLNKIYLHVIDYSVRSSGDAGPALTKAVEAATRPPIVMTFNVEAEGKEGEAVVDVTSLFTSDPPDFSARAQVGGAGVDPGRSWVESMRAFPTNVETRSTLTFMVANRGQSNPLAALLGLGGSDASAATCLVHYSLILLPETPMRGRLADSRVGYFTRGFTVYGAPKNRVDEQAFINRHRLEKKDPTAEVSEPVKPIVYYISREVPEQWRSYIKKGVEDWQPAFEQAGFKNAIQAKNAPTLEEDPNWHPEDARYNVIRWAPQPVANAMGPNVHDPRSGEIISAHIIFWHDILKLLEAWYFVQVGHMDPKAKTLPLPEDVMGELVRYVAAHEVGHTLGLQHNFKASSSFTVAQLRDGAFTRANGLSASIMDYARFNYVAQPGDDTALMSIVSHYDKFAIEWGYKPIDARSSEGERFQLDLIASRQVNDPRLRFGNFPGLDPMTQTEDIGSDPMAATGLGLANLERIMKMLIPATTKFGEDYSYLATMYGELLGQRSTELAHVAGYVGGIVETDYHAGRGGAVFTPIPKAKQKEAVAFLAQHAFQSPAWLAPNEILQRIEPMGAQNRLLSLPRSLMSSLLSEGRFTRLYDLQAQHGAANVYTAPEVIADVQAAIWSELNAPAPTVSLFRRNLQRAYLDTVEGRLNGSGRTRTDAAGYWRSKLTDLKKASESASKRATDAASRLHFAESARRIEDILNPKAAAPAAASSPQAFPFFIHTAHNHGPDCFHGAADREAVVDRILAAQESRLPNGATGR